MGTITEVYDYLRLLYARVGRPHCPVCGRPIARQAPQQIVDRVLELAEGTRFQVLAPVIRERKGEYTELLRELQLKGYTRARIDGTIVRLDESPVLARHEQHTIEVVVDRLAVKEDARRRLTDSVETALGLSGGVVLLDFVDLADDDPHRERMYSEHLACLYDDLSFDELEPRSFSFNSPWGACPDCTGLGTRMEVDPGLIVPDPAKTLAEGAIDAWGSGQGHEYFMRLMAALGDTLGFGMDTPFSELPDPARTLCCTDTPSRYTCTTRPPGAGNAPTTRRSRARSRSSSGGTPRRRVTPAGSGSRASCARCPARPAREPGSSPSPGP